MSTGKVSSETRSKLVDELADIMPSYFSRNVEGLDLATDRPGVSEKPSMSGLDELRKPMDEAQKQRTELWKDYQLNYLITPPVASSVRRESIERLRREFELANSSFTIKQVVVMDKTLTALKEEHTDAQEEFDERQKQLEITLNKRMTVGQEVAPGAPPPELNQLEKSRSELFAKIKDEKSTMDTLATLDEEIENFGEQIEQTRKRVQKRQERKQTILTAMSEVRQHPDSQPEALNKARCAVSDPLKSEALTDEALDESNRALELLQKEALELANFIAFQKLKYEEYMKQFEHALKQANQKCFTGDSIQSVIAPESPLGDRTAPPFDDDTAIQMKLFPGKLREFQDQANLTAKQKIADLGNHSLLVEYLKEESRQIFAAWERLDSLPGKAQEKKPMWMVNAVSIQTESYLSQKAPKLKKEQLLKWQTNLNLAHIELEKLRDDKGLISTVDYQRQKDELLAMVAPGDPPKVASDFQLSLAKLREAVRKELHGKFDQKGLTRAKESALSFVRLLVRAEEDTVHAVFVNGVRNRLKINWAEVFKGVTGPVKLKFEKELQAAEKEATKKGTDRNMQRARGLFVELEKRFNLIKDDRRSLLLESLETSRSGTMESETAERVYDLLGPDLLTKLGTGERADRDMLTVCEAFQAASAPEVKSLEDLFNEGFANNESVILAVVRAGDGKALRALATSFGGEEEQSKLDRENLGQMINGGGLGDNPAVLIDLLTFGVKDAEDKNVKRMENINKLKSLGNKFGAEKGAPRLKTLLDDCGLATRPSTNRPGAFAEILLNDGCSVEDLYDFAGKLEQEDKVNLKALMKHGGFGEHPGPLTPLVKDNKLDVLKDIGNAFREPSDRSNLKKIMDNGGLSGDTSRPGKEHEHTDTLNQVYKDGLEGSAENLLTFTKAFSLVPGQCKMMLDAWNEYPESKKIHREPGKQIAKVLQRIGGDNIDQQIAKLQSQFTSKIDTQVRPSHKAKAIRFAPDLATESAPHDMEKPEDLPESYNLMGNYLCRRHVPKYFSKSDVKDENTMWPPGTDSAKLTEYLQAAISEGGLPTDRNDTRHPDIGGGKEVELGAVPDQFQVDKFALNHFHAGHGWPDTADPMEVVKFTRSDLLGMCAAVGV